MRMEVFANGGPINHSKILKIGRHVWLNNTAKLKYLVIRFVKSSIPCIIT